MTKLQSSRHHGLYQHHSLGAEENSLVNEPTKQERNRVLILRCGLSTIPLVDKKGGRT